MPTLLRSICMGMLIALLVVEPALVSVGQANHPPLVSGCRWRKSDAEAGRRDAWIYSFTRLSRRQRRRLLERARPICLVIGNLHLRVPRNFLTAHGAWSGGRQDSVTIEVTYPGLQPFDRRTVGCFEGKLPCSLQGVTILPSAYTSDKMFRGAHLMFRNKVPVQAPGGYDMYKVGPDQFPAREEYYTKKSDGRVLRFECNPPQPSIHFSGICDRFMPFLDGTVIYYRFSYEDIPNEEHRDSRLRSLVHSFIIQDGLR